MLIKQSSFFTKSRHERNIYLNSVQLLRKVNRYLSRKSNCSHLNSTVKLWMKHSLTFSLKNRALNFIYCIKHFYPPYCKTPPTTDNNHLRTQGDDTATSCARACGFNDILRAMIEKRHPLTHVSALSSLSYGFFLCWRSYSGWFCFIYFNCRRICNKYLSLTLNVSELAMNSTKAGCR